MAAVSLGSPWGVGVGWVSVSGRCEQERGPGALGGSECELGRGQSNLTPCPASLFDLKPTLNMEAAQRGTRSGRSSRGDRVSECLSLSFGEGVGKEGHGNVGWPPSPWQPGNTSRLYKQALEMVMVPEWLHTC